MAKTAKINREGQDTIDLLDAVFSLTDGVRESLAGDGKITLTDIPYFIGPLMKLPAAISGIENIPSELSGLSPAARQDVIDYFKGRFDLPNDALELKLETALQTGYEFAVAIYAFVPKAA